MWGMKKDLKKRWLAALRGGQYHQTNRALRRAPGFPGALPGFCCLGVLCDVADPRGWEDSEAWRPSTDPECPASSGDLGSGALRYLGLRSQEMEYLVILNDERHKSFSDIADWIETNVFVE